jgi:GntR family transcriptional repressor for pyruvate dehydrogenase complex
MSSNSSWDGDGGPPLAPISRSPLYKQVRARLQLLIERANLHPGDRLPSERDLALQLGISRNSLRPALAALEALGVIEIRHGSGLFLSTPDPQEIAESLAVVLVEQNVRLPEVMEARMALERFAVGLAAGRRTEEELERATEALESMRAELAAGNIGVEADREFHETIWAAAHNTVLGDLLSRLGDDVGRIREESLSQPGRPERSLAAHERILEAISNKDPRAAVAAMDAHLAEVADTPLVRGGPGDSDRAD